MQTYRNFEVIIINDGSTDCSIDIINIYKDKFNNFQYLEQENKGASDARNLGVSKANGEFIMFVDSDDYLEGNALKLIHSKMMEKNADMAIVGHNKVYKGNQVGDVDHHIFSIDDKHIFSNVDVLKMLLNFEVKGYICDKIFKKDMWREHNIFFENRRYCEDWFPITKYIIESKRIVFVNQPLYNYRQHNESSIHDSNIKVIRDYNYAVSNIVSYILESNIQYVNSDMCTFQLITLNETIHEFYKLKRENGLIIYEEFYLEQFNFWNFSMNNILFGNNLNIKNKLSILSWKMRVYHILRPIFNSE